MLILRETRYPFDGKERMERIKGGEGNKEKEARGKKMEEAEYLEKDHDMNFLCYTARGIMIVTREEMFVLYIS